jgi:hypothetical protein
MAAIGRSATQQQIRPLGVDADPNLRALPVFEASSGPATAMRSIGNNLAQLASEAGAWADQAATAEGQRAGKIDGGKSAYEPTRANTIWGRAYDTAGNATFLNSIEVAARGEMMDATLRYPDQPAMLRKEIDGIRQKYTQQVSQNVPELGADVDATIARTGDGYVFAAGKAFQEKQQREDRETFVIQQAQNRDDLQRRARANPNEPKLAQTLDAEVQKLDEQIDARTDLSPLQKQRLKNDHRLGVAKSMIQGQIEAVTDPAALDRLGQSLEQQWQKKEGAIGRLDADSFDAVRDAVTQRRGQLQKAQAAQARVLDGSVDEVKRYVLSGETVPGAVMARTMVQLQQADPTGATAEKVKSLEALHGWGQTFRTLNVGDQRATLTALDEKAVRKGLNETEENRRELARNILTQREKDEKTDPLGTAGKTFGAPVADLEFGASNFGEQARRRIVEAERLASEQGRAVTYLKQADRDRLKQAVEADPSRAVAVGQQILQGFGEKAPAVLREISADLPGLAFALRPNNPALVNDWKRAREAEAQGVKTAEVPMADVRERMKDEGFDQLMQGRDLEMAQMAEAARPIIAARLGPTVSKFNPLDADHKRVMGDVLAELAGRNRDVRTGREMGGPVKVNGHVTVAPAQIEPAKFSQLLRVITEADLDAVGVKPRDAQGRPVPLSDLTGARWHPAGRDRYRVALEPTMKSANPWVGGVDGKPLEIDLSPSSPLMNRLRQRAPGLFR